MPLKLKQGKHGRLLRLGLQGRSVRLSRTGGFALRHQIKKRGVTITGNSSTGIRASKRVARGTQIAIQNGRPILRGRYTAGSSNLNLSRSGLSASVRNRVGALNWSHPRRSSASIGGLQFRGGTALTIHFLYFLLFLPIQIVKMIMHKRSSSKGGSN